MSMTTSTIAALSPRFNLHARSVSAPRIWRLRCVSWRFISALNARRAAISPLRFRVCPTLEAIYPHSSRSGFLQVALSEVLRRRAFHHPLLYPAGALPINANDFTGAIRNVAVQGQFPSRA